MSTTLLQPRPAARTYGKPKPDAPQPPSDLNASVPLARQSSNIPSIQSESVVGPSKVPQRRALLVESSSEEEREEDAPPSSSSSQPKQAQSSSQPASPDEFLSKFGQRKSIAQMLAEADATSDSDGESEVDVQATLAQLRAKPTQPQQQQPQAQQAAAAPSSDSTLTSLVTSQDPNPSQSTSLTRPHSRTTSTEKGSNVTPRQAQVHRARSTSPGLLQQIEDFLPKQKTAIVSSATGSDEEEESAPVGGRVKAPRRIVVDSDDSDNDNAAGTTSAPTTLSKKERVEALARKRAPPPPAEVPAPEAPVERSMSAIEDSSEDERARQRAARKSLSSKGKGKERPLSKKGEEEMNKETAKLARGQNMRLEPRVKEPKSIAEIMARARAQKEVKSTAELKPLSSHRPLPVARDSGSGEVQETPRKALATTSSVSAIEGVSSSSPPAAFSAQNDNYNNDDLTTPIAQRKLPPGAPTEAVALQALSADEEDEDLDLPSVDDLLARSAAKKLAEAEAQKKAQRQARIQAMAAKMAAEADSDSDFEIEGAPHAAAAAGNNKSLLSSSPVVGRTPGSLSKSARKMKLINPKWGQHTAKITDSQLDRAGHTFGLDLGEGHHISLQTKSKRNADAAKEGGGGRKEKVAHVGMDELEARLLEKTRAQNHATRLNKQKKYRAKQQAQLQQIGEQAAPVDMKALLERKHAKLQRDRENGVEEDDEDGDEFDADYEDGEALDSDEQMEELEGDESGSGSEQEQEEEEEEPQASGDKPTRRSTAVRDDDEDEEEENAVAAAPAGRRRVRVAASDDEDEEVTPPAAFAALNPTHLSHAPEQAARIQLPDLFGAGAGAGFGGLGGDDDDAGFSQFFAGGLSQEATEAGFKRNTDDDAMLQLSPPRAFMNPINITANERLDDAEKLDQLAAFWNGGTPATPREMERPRQYINKLGHMTQTRPVNLYDDSPGGFSQSQEMMSQTQLMTPTATKGKKSGGLMGRMSSLLALGETSSASELQPEPTELEPTEVHPRATVPEDEEEDEEDEDVAMADGDLAMPTAAQPHTNPANAFELLKAAQQQQQPAADTNAARGGLKRSKNAFIDTEADLSEDELLGLGGLSGDENEDGLDAELESLVDNEEVDRELGARQDVLARERHQEELDKADAAELLKAQRVAEGKERLRRKNGGVDLSDDDFDDDDYGVSKRRLTERKEAQNKTIAQLQEDEETQAFASNFKEGLHVPVAPNQYGFLAEPGSDVDSQLDSQDEEDEGEEEDMESTQSGSIIDSPQLQKRAMTAREADQLAVEASRKRKAAQLERQDHAKRQSLVLRSDEDPDSADELDFLGGGREGSSPVQKFKLATKKRILRVAEPVEYAAPGAGSGASAGYSLYAAHSATQAAKDMARYKSGESASGGAAREKEESQGNGTTSGAMSSVTSFARRGAGAAGATVREKKVAEAPARRGAQQVAQDAGQGMGRKLSRLASIRQPKRGESQ